MAGRGASMLSRAGIRLRPIVPLTSRLIHDFPARLNPRQPWRDGGDAAEWVMRVFSSPISQLTPRDDDEEKEEPESEGLMWPWALRH